MNKKMFEAWVRDTPPTVSASYLFVVDNTDIAINILSLNMRCIYLDAENEDCFSVDGLIDYLKGHAETFEGVMLNGYHFVLSCFSRQSNERLAFGINAAGYDCKQGWHIFRNREYLGKYDKQPELEKFLLDYIRRFEGEDSEELVNKERFLKYGKTGEVIGVYDSEIVEYIMDSIPFFVMDEQPYIYEHGVYIMDEGGIYLKDAIQKLVPKYLLKSNIIKSIYLLLIMQKKVQKRLEELNAYPKHWINFKNCMFDPIGWKMKVHKPEYYSINQIPHVLEPDVRKNLEAAGSQTITYLQEAIPNKQDQTMLMQYIGYCMTTDSKFQKFLILKGDGGTGKSVIVSLVQNLIGKRNYSTVSLENINQRFYPAELMGKLLNACADIESAPLSSVDTIKKVTGEDTLMYERKGRDPKAFTSYAKLLFSANKIPLNLDEKTSAFYRRLLILEMNVKPKAVDPDLKDKLVEEVQYLIWMALLHLRVLYQDGRFTESDNSKRQVEELYRAADSVKAFMDETVVRTNSDTLIKRDVLYGEYRKYCGEYGRKEYSSGTFYRMLEERGYHSKRKSNGRYFVGIALKEEGFLELDEEGQQELPFANTSR